MVSAVGPDQRDSAGQEEARKTTSATSPEADLSSSVPHCSSQECSLKTVNASVSLLLNIIWNMNLLSSVLSEHTCHKDAVYLG